MKYATILNLKLFHQLNTPNSPVWIHVLFSNTPQITLESQTCVLFGTNTSKTLAPPRGDYCVTSVGPH